MATSSSYTLHSVIIQSIILCLIWIVCTVGNVLVCVVIYRSRRLQSTTNYFVISLAASDLALALLIMPFLLGEDIAGGYVFGLGVCKMMRYFQFLLPASSMYVLVFIGIDRFYTILYPLSFKVSRTGAKKMILAGWIFAAFLASPCFYFYKLNEDDKVIECANTPADSWTRSAYIICYVTLTFVAPATGVAIGYIHIFRYIWHISSKPWKLQRTANAVPLAKVRTVHMLMWVNLVVILLLAPYYLAVLCQSSSSVILGRTAYVVVTWLLCSTSAVKPIMYLRLNSNFRRGCKEVFCMSAMKCYRSNAYTITTSSKFAKKNHVGVLRDMDNSDQQIQPLKSPTETFDRSAMVDKVAWPFPSRSAISHL